MRTSRSDFAILLTTSERAEEVDAHEPITVQASKPCSKVGQQRFNLLGPSDHPGPLASRNETDVHREGGERHHAVYPMHVAIL